MPIYLCTASIAYHFGEEEVLVEKAEVSCLELHKLVSRQLLPTRRAGKMFQSGTRNFSIDIEQVNKNIHFSSWKL